MQRCKLSGLPTFQQTDIFKLLPHTHAPADRQGKNHPGTTKQPTLRLHKYGVVATQSNLTTLLRCSMLYFQQVQALLTLFTKSLFTFPSGYVFALDIGLICSCRWRLPPNLCSRPEKRDSCSACRARGDANDKWDSHPH